MAAIAADASVAIPDALHFLATLQATLQGTQKEKKALCACPALSVELVTLRAERAARVHATMRVRT